MAQSTPDGQPRPAHRARRLVPGARAATARTCTSGSVLVFDGEPPALRRLRRARRVAAAPGAPLPPAARVPAARRLAARVGRRRALQRRATTCATPRCRSRAATPQLRAARGARVLAAARPRQAAVGDLARRRGVEGDRFALICKTHHALVDGISGVDIMTVLFDLEPDPPAPRAARRAWTAAPGAERRGAVRGRAGGARGGAARRALRDALAHPDRAGAEAGRAVAGLASMVAAGVAGAPPSPLNVRIGPHRRFAWVEADLGAVQGDQGRARRHGQRRRADGRRGRAARAAAPPRARDRAAWS